MTLGGRRFLLVIAVAGAILCLALGVSQPFVRPVGSMFPANEHSLMSAVSALVRSGQFPLGAVLLLFAIFLPVLKLLYLLLLAMLPLRDIDRLGRQLRALAWLGRWSLLDLVALALAIALIARQRAVEAAGAVGISAFATAVALMLLAHAWLRSNVAASRAPAIKAAHAPGMRASVFHGLLVLAAALLAAGVMLPAVRLPGSFAGSNQHSVMSLVQGLYTRQAYFPSLVLFALAIALPGLKLLYLVALTIARTLPYGLRMRSLSAVEWLGGHPIADVMLLGLTAFYLGAAGQVLPGAYCFGASALATMLAYGLANAPVSATVQHTSLSARLAGLAGTPDETPARR
jgi:paraquat-inducible protein A